MGDDCVQMAYRQRPWYEFCLPSQTGFTGKTPTPPSVRRVWLNHLNADAVLDGGMVNFLVVGGRPFNGGSFDWTEAGSDAARLARQYYALSDQNGMLPLTGSITVPAMGSVGYQFTIVLVETGDRLDVVVYRETVSEKFTPHMTDQDRRASGELWSSVCSK